MDLRECNTCHKVKPIEQFHFVDKARGRRNHQCAECKNAAQRLARKLHPDTTRLYNRVYWHNHPDKREAANAKKREAYWADVEASGEKHNEMNRRRREKCTSMN